ncbi:MAG: SAM-dependent methyltransferase [Candidatus Binatia bacterium]
MRSLLSMALLALSFIMGCTLPLGTEQQVPFNPTPMEVVDRMLDVAQVKESDLIYDLGSGDGRIVTRAAQRFGTRGIGIEINRHLNARARRIAAEQGVSHLVEFRRQDALTVDVSNATVVTLYMLPEFNARLRPVLQKQLRPGARVVSHDFGIEGWKPSREEKIPGGMMHEHTIYLWTIE